MAQEPNQPAFARTPEPPYYAVIFTSRPREGDDGYAEMAEKMATLALRQPGCLGAESARNADGFGLIVSYFPSEADIRAWKGHAEHPLAQALGQTRWYERYEIRVAEVVRAYSGPRGRDRVAVPPAQEE